MSDTTSDRQSTHRISSNETTVRAEGITKNFGSICAVDNVEFEIREGEFFSLLGPSGCGKTTTLRMIAGFEEPTGGSIRLHQEDISTVAPYARDAGMVFQGYALFPHKTVGENVGFGLKMEGVPKGEREPKVAEALELVNLPGVEDRSPDQLSGGQQQRVALARALVIEPSVLLLDEPLSNLDYMLRKEMRFELKRIQEELNITTIYVTHDQEEALAMSDRILVMNDGRTQQIGSPFEIYNEPATEFVADFIGESNLLSGRIGSVSDETVSIDLTDIDQEAITAAHDVVPPSISVGDDVLVSLRPEDLQLSDRVNDPMNRLVGRVEARTFLGKATRYLLDVHGTDVLVEISGRDHQQRYQNGDEMELTWPIQNCTVLHA